MQLHYSLSLLWSLFYSLVTKPKVPVILIMNEMSSDFSHDHTLPFLILLFNKCDFLVCKINKNGSKVTIFRCLLKGNTYSFVNQQSEFLK